MTVKLQYRIHLVLDPVSSVMRQQVLYLQSLLDIDPLQAKRAEVYIDPMRRGHATNGKILNKRTVLFLFPETSSTLQLAQELQQQRCQNPLSHPPFKILPSPAVTMGVICLLLKGSMSP